MLTHIWKHNIEVIPKLKIIIPCNNLDLIFFNQNLELIYSKHEYFKWALFFPSKLNSLYFD